MIFPVSSLNDFHRMVCANVYHVLYCATDIVPAKGSGPIQPLHPLRSGITPFCVGSFLAGDTLITAPPSPFSPIPLFRSPLQHSFVPFTRQGFFNQYPMRSLRSQHLSFVPDPRNLAFLKVRLFTFFDQCRVASYYHAVCMQDI